MFPDVLSVLVVGVLKEEMAGCDLPVTHETTETPTYNMKFCCWLLHFCGLILDNWSTQAHFSWTSLVGWKGAHQICAASNCLCHQVVKTVIKL